MRHALADAVLRMPDEDAPRLQRLADDVRAERVPCNIFDIASDYDLPLDTLIREMTEIVEGRFGFTQLTPKARVH
jgi:hypothetical protein